MSNAFRSRLISSSRIFLFFFFNDTATTEIYTLSLHDALPISKMCLVSSARHGGTIHTRTFIPHRVRSEEHTSELQSQSNLVCRLLLEKKKKTRTGCTPSRAASSRSLWRKILSRMKSRC